MSKTRIPKDFLIAGMAVALGLSVIPAFAQDFEEVTFVVGNNLFSTPAFIAVENGYWVDRGLNVQLRLVGSGREITQALNAGEAELGGANMGTTTASARASGNMLKGVIPYYNNALYISIAGGRGIVGRADSGITSDPSSFVGKTVGSLNGSTQEVYLRQFLASGGVAYEDVEVINVPVPDMPISLAQGLVDATVPWEPYLSQSLRELGDNGVEVSRAAPGYVADVIGVLANEEFIAANPELLEQFALGMLEATRFVRQNPEDAAQIATYYLDGLNLDDASSGIRYMSWDPRISICTDEGLMQTGNEMIEDGLIVADPFVAEDFADRAVLDKVLGENPELTSDLAALPTDLADCQGAL
ncbi:ABC transporter substrate-binding protein [Pelagibacterium flavum]|uniref:ABC transporter substrate-binding protein n=1 Tax=Pelagibacterium flavum TaxID=2984530 RepID=A0ABY6IV83_9HYPH|nr:ABC transporter substrate-binding protein [Pelagibacterium sp. YIM 151497]UYQ73095.1 ABC transporter substrate-binding protein [Pelagibacterium sp. YIM 151497]